MVLGSLPFACASPVYRLAIKAKSLFILETNRAFNSHKSLAGAEPGKANVVRPSGNIPMAASCMVGK